MTTNKQSADFSIYSAFLKGINTYSLVIKSIATLRGEKRKWFNMTLLGASNLEKEVHKYLGPENAKVEDEMSCLIVDHVRYIFELPDQDRHRFFEHINKFEI